MKKYCIKSDITKESTVMPAMVMQILFVDNNGARARVGIGFWTNETIYDAGEKQIVSSAVYVCADQFYAPYFETTETEKVAQNDFTAAREWLLNREPVGDELDFRSGVALDK